MSNASSRLSIFQTTAKVTSIIVLGFASMVLSGWLFDLESLKGALAAGINVKTNTAICFFLSGLALYLFNFFNPSSVKAILRLLGPLVFLIGACTLFQHLTGVNLGIDELFFSEQVGVVATASPNRMGPPASINFMLVGVSIILLTALSATAKETASTLGLLVGVIAVVPAFGYLFDAYQLYSIAHFTGISLSTAIAFLILSASLVCSCLDSQFIRLLSSDDAGGVLARRLIPPALLLPPLLGYLRTKGEQFELYDTAFGRSILITAFILIVARLVWSSAKQLQAADLERTNLIESERAARSYAERANRFKDEFLATVSHELRTPLNAILGWSQLLKRKPPTADELNTGLAIIERNSRMQAQLIDDLLDASRILSGKFNMKFQVVDLLSVLQAAVDAITIEAKAKQIEIETNFETGSAIINGDYSRLQQIFWNIFTNAIKFTPAGGRIKVNLQISSDSVLVAISDTGQGIESDFLNQIFDRFTQADSSATRKYRGLGIGLSVVRELVGLHGGHVRAESPGLGLGSTFLISLPLAVGSQATANKIDFDAQVEPLTLAPRDSLGNIKVLVVDDETDARDLTAFVREEDKKIATNSGYQAHLSKPVNAHELLATVSRLVSQHYSQ